MNSTPQALINITTTFDILNFHKQPILEILLGQAGVLDRLTTSFSTLLLLPFF